MHNYTLILNHTSRSDIRHYFTNCLYESAQLYNMLADLRLEKGLFIKAPTVEVPKEVSFVKSSSFMTDFFGEKRPLINREITHMFAIILANIIGKALVTGFGQVAKRKTVSDYFFKGSELASELIGSISSIHIEEGIPIPSTSDSFVTDSTISPFSDKLMMNHITAMNSMSLSGLGIALAESMRTDLQVTYGRFVAKVFNYAKEGADIMIEENWMEQPPQAINHKNLGKHK